MEILQKHQEKFWVIGVIAKRFYDAGLGDVALESGVIVVGSVGWVLNGMTYKRAIWFHKFMCEACLRLTPKGFFECLIEAKWTEVILAKFGASIEVFFFFFYLSFLLRPFTNHRTAGEGGGHFFNSSLPLPPVSQTQRH